MCYAQLFLLSRSGAERLTLFCAEQTNEQAAESSTELCQYAGVEGSFIHEETLFGFSLRWSTD
jgi:hypothetical protein